MNATTQALLIDQTVRDANERHKGQAIIQSGLNAHYKRGGEITHITSVMVYVYVGSHVVQLNLNPSDNIRLAIDTVIDSLSRLP